jgi:hypothetical protein
MNTTKYVNWPGAATRWYATTGTTIPAPCSDCHATLSATVHGGNHGDACSECHILIPHAWKRPRLLRRTTGGTLDGKTQDAAPYVNGTGNGLLAYRLAAASTNFRTQGSCIVGTGCSSHSTSGGTPYWP